MPSISDIVAASAFLIQLVGFVIGAGMAKQKFSDMEKQLAAHEVFHQTMLDVQVAHSKQLAVWAETLPMQFTYINEKLADIQKRVRDLQRHSNTAQREEDDE